MEIVVPGRGTLSLAHVVFDWNGTLARDGRLLPSVVEPYRALKAVLTCHILTAASHGPPDEALSVLGTTPRVVRDGAEKARHVAALEGGVVAIGNGSNDARMFAVATLAVAVVGEEGAAREAVLAADVVVARPEEAILLLLRPTRLVATLRP